jgi:pimeloyl-ACP methyl ester carboxylesterase
MLWDRRGCGNSTRRSGGVDIASAVADLDAVLEAAGLGAAAVHLVGQAMGGMVSAAWALAHQARVVTLALWDGPFGLLEDRRSMVWKLEPDDTGVAATLEDRQISRTPAVARGFQDSDPVGTYLYQTIQELGTARPSYHENFAAAKAAGVPVDGLARLGVPVLLGRGEFDHVVGDQALAEIASLIPRATTVTLAGGGHSPYFEIPGAWNAAMRAHLNRAQAKPGP